ncbi:hypothetical protein LMG7141_00914 [Ralstonia condita]|jgi:hypothetical protein|uniref:LRAT domain-containing protein n=1 Tax=Ralstonia condita TaxID=3058600 RepID=A0ABM9J1X2_9RALS|nr:lecithin retinol acyltransferase family protein [Ralstonia sp. LMG 7141]MDE2204271.1 lecithin retinol acyltransferase family protein [Burkholderiaceae bacterium]CAJ0779662.1 hypothetical protein LMG7141_00914 [Ralstonia sp. LMG 7141]
MHPNHHEDRNLRGTRSDAAADTLFFSLGAHLVTQREGYEHHGIYVGDGQVIHYAGFCHGHRRGPVERVSTDAFACGHPVHVRTDRHPRYEGAEVARRAGSRLGESNYRLLTNNCEHFCAWCLFGECRSEQVNACLKSPARALRAAAGLFMAAMPVPWRTLQASPRAT